MFPSARVLSFELEPAPFNSQFCRKKMSTRDLVLSLLAEAPFLRCSQLAFLVRKLRQERISNQAVHKVLNQMVVDNILLKFEGKYCINDKWLESVELFFRKTRDKIALEPAIIVK